LNPSKAVSVDIAWLYIIHRKAPITTLARPSIRTLAFVPVPRRNNLVWNVRGALIGASPIALHRMHSHTVVALSCRGISCVVCVCVCVCVCVFVHACTPMGISYDFILPSQRPSRHPRRWFCSTWVILGVSIIFLQPGYLPPQRKAGATLTPTTLLVRAFVWGNGY